MQKGSVDRGESALPVSTGWSVPLGFHHDGQYVANSLLLSTALFGEYQEDI